MIRALLLTLMLGSCASAAGDTCAERSEVLQHMATQYREVPVAMGLSNKGHVMELLVGPNGSWTLMSTDTSGRACLTDAGEHFQARRR